MSSVQKEAKQAKRSYRLPPETGIAVVVLILLIMGSLATPNFLTVSNMAVLLLNGAVIGLPCLGRTFVLLTGGIDLACGSVVAMTCVFGAVLMQYLGLHWIPAAVIVLGIGALVGIVSDIIELVVVSSEEEELLEIADRIVFRHGDHLMLEHPEPWIHQFGMLGVRSIAFHAEAVSDVKSAASSIRAAGCLAYISFRPETPVSRISHLLPKADGILLLTAPPGGGEFNPAALERLRHLPRE